MFSTINPVQRSPEVAPLIKLNAMKRNSELKYFHSQVDDFVIDILQAIQYRIENNQDGESFLFLAMPWSTTPREDIPEWTENLENFLADASTYGYRLEYHHTISTVLSSRLKAVKVYSYKDAYIVFSSKSYADPDEYYKFVLATMLLDDPDNRSFIERATSVVTQPHGARFILSDYEKELIKEYDVRIRKENLKAAINKLMQPKRPTREITAKQTARNELMERLRVVTNELNELIQKDYAIQFLLQSANDSATQDILEYIDEATARGNLLELTYNDQVLPNYSYLYVTSSSYLRLTEEDLDFVKPSAIENSRHLLHGMPKTTAIIRAVAEQRLRVPIIARYRFRFDPDMRLTEVAAAEELYAIPDPDFKIHEYIINAHIQRFNCFASYKRMMVDALMDNDLIQMFEIMQQCTGTINIFEDPVNRYIVDSIIKLSPTTPVQIKRDAGWENITLDEFIEEEQDNEID